jgi:hypothetical protein
MARGVANAGAAGYLGGMLRRRLVLAVAAAVIVLAVTLGLESSRLFSAVRHRYYFDAVFAMVILTGFTVVARWIGWTGPAARWNTATATRTPRAGFRTFPLLWGGFAIAVFIVICAVPWQGPNRGSYFDRLLGRSVVPASAEELAGKAAANVCLAVLIGWFLQAFVVLVLGLLTGGPSFVRAGAEPTADEYAAGLRRAGWSVRARPLVTDAGPVWQVDGRKGERTILARADTQTAAWRLAVEQAAAMLER